MDQPQEVTIPRGRGRPKLPPERQPERINLKAPAGTNARLDAVLEEGEVRLDVIRMAIDREVERRERKARKA